MSYFLTALNACQDTLLDFFTEQPSMFQTMVFVGPQAFGEVASWY